MSCPRVVRIVTPGPPGPGLTVTGPVVAGRASGTGGLVPIPLGSGLSIVDGALTVAGTGTGTVTSVGLMVPTGFNIANSPITNSGTLAISFAAGYSLPTTAKQGQWDQAFADLGQARTPTVHGHAISDVTGLQTALGAKADLVSGLVPASQLPSFVDDVLEYASFTAFPVTGEPGKLYVSLATGRVYRWAGSAYIEIISSPGSTDAVPEGSVNLYHTTARAAAAAPVQSVAGRTGNVTLTKGDVGLGNVDNTSDADKPVSTATATALGGKAGTGAIGSSGLTMAAGRVLIGPETGTGAPREATLAPDLIIDGTAIRALRDILIPLSDESTALATGVRLTVPYWPKAMVLTELPIWMVGTAPTGAALQLDIRVGGTSIFSTLPTIAAGSTSSVGGTPAVFSTAFVSGGQQIASGALVTVHVLQIGSTVAGAGLKVSLATRRVG